MTTTRALEPAQAKAAHTLDRHISVVAGPGAGKTTVLVERYLHILREKKPSSIDQIVAITFTNRAANEMRERLRHALDVLLANARGAERQRWMRYKRTLDGGVITTIHGFCMRLLREFPVESGLDPQFMLLDEHRSATLLTAAVEESLTEFLGRRDEPVSRLTAGIGRPLLATELWEMYLKVRGQGLSLDRILKQTATSHAANDDYAALCEQLDAAMRELISMRRLTARANEKREAAEKGWNAVKEILLAEDVTLADYCGAIVEFREAARPDARQPLTTMVRQLDELFWGESKDKPFGRLPQMRFDLLARDYATALVNLLKNIDRRFTEKKLELSALDFDDLQLRTLELLKKPEVLERAFARYKFFLVDEFQDTNGLQRDLLDALALNSRARANLFIVGDRKQSIYGFRGADVDVFTNMSAVLQAAGGELVPLPLNFRSQPKLINFFNYLFARFFRPSEDIPQGELGELGHVEHEMSVARRDVRDPGPLVELMIDTLRSEDDPKGKQSVRERDAKQLVRRIIDLTRNRPDVTKDDQVVEPHGEQETRSHSELSPEGTGRLLNADAFEYRDIALLFRAMTDVPVYEAEFRRAGIPFQTVLGKGFYEREEITDLIQLCRFLDNRTDELALAAVLRSPLCGISDNTLLALRLGPNKGETVPGEAPQMLKRPRALFRALRGQSEIDFINEDDREALNRALALLDSLIERRNRYPIGELLRFAVEESRFTAVVAATYDGAQRLANVEKLFNLAERFERSGAHLIRDFVKYVHDFEAIGSRESEGQLDDSANAVKIMTIHQAKGLEFPVVIIPDLQRLKPSWEGYFLLDRHRGLTLKVPNGRGQMVAGSTFGVFNQRAGWRDAFESMRLLYVAATRAQDRLILSGATKDLNRLSRGDDSWLQLIWQALDLATNAQSEVVKLDEGTELKLTYNLVDQQEEVASKSAEASQAEPSSLDEDLATTFPLIRPIQPGLETGVHRFSVTQLINYQRCPRQYYFDRVLNVPSADQLAVWNDAEAPEPPANLTATLKGAVIHRFCETYSRTDDAEALLRKSFADIVRSRQSELADRLVEIDTEHAISELFPLAQNYLGSGVFERVERARALTSESRRMSLNPAADKPGLWSELSFRLRRPLGILTGAIDKLLVTPSGDNNGFQIEIVDFKTNRMRPVKQAKEITVAQTEPEFAAASANHSLAHSRRRLPVAQNQIAFDFSSPTTEENVVVSIEDQVSITASDYQLQMQAYALAVSELMPALSNKGAITVTLHFLDPNIEFKLAGDVISRETCMQAIDNAMMEIISSTEPQHFPPRPAMHCRMCSFLGICPAGRDWVRSHGMKRGLQKVAEASR